MRRWGRGTPRGRRSERMPSDRIHYQRSRFSTWLPQRPLYTAGHYWIEPEGEGGTPEGERVWRVGLTKFAVRMLGEAVELDFEIESSAPVSMGQVVGWIEGFKAVTDLFSPLRGRFEGANPDLFRDMELLHRDPYGKGWLFRVRGKPGEDCFDVHRYVSTLDATIDRMLGQRHDPT